MHDGSSKHLEAPQSLDAGNVQWLFGIHSKNDLHGCEVPWRVELELELIQTQMAQKPMLRAEVYAHAMRASQNRKKEVRGALRMCGTCFSIHNQHYP